ncbi:MAG: hypothetical protein VX341_09940, partial [Bdellovibrionota bacterium]|nr:hypothetical protein [Bdellovibrionota bacterium]
NSGSWTVASDTESQSNSVDEISTTLKEFISSGPLYVRAYLKSNGSESCQLDEVIISEKI